MRGTIASVLVLATVLVRAEPPRDEPSIIIGACTHFGQRKGAVELNLDWLRRAGIASIRDELYWSSVERSRGELAMPDGRDRYLRAASRAGLDPLLILDYGNRFYDEGRHPTSPGAIEGFCRYAEFLVRELGESVRRYEIWNEWDIGIGLPERTRGSPRDYFRLLRAVSKRIRAVDPDVTVAGAGGPTSGGIDRGWLEELVELGALDHCDVISIHSYNYSAPGPRGGPEAWERWTHGVEDMLREHNEGEDVPVWITEMGWPSHAGPRGRDTEICAAYLARLYLLARTMDFVEGIWWYDFQDDGWNRRHNEHNFGLVRPDLTPKPAYHALEDLSRLVKHGRFLGEVAAGRDDVRVLRFRLDEAETWAVWSADDRPHQVVFRHPGEDEPGPLAVREAGRRSFETRWGHRAWAEERGAELQPARFSLTVGALPWIVAGDIAGAEVVEVTPRGGRPQAEEER